MRENLMAGCAKAFVHIYRIGELICVTNCPFYLEITVSDLCWGRDEHEVDWAVNASPALPFLGHPIARGPIDTALERTREPCRY